MFYIYDRYNLRLYIYILRQFVKNGKIETKIKDSKFFTFSSFFGIKYK